MSYKKLEQVLKELENARKQTQAELEGGIIGLAEKKGRGRPKKIVGAGYNGSVRDQVVHTPGNAPKASVIAMGYDPAMPDYAHSTSAIGQVNIKKGGKAGEKIFGGTFYARPTIGGREVGGCNSCSKSGLVGGKSFVGESSMVGGKTYLSGGELAGGELAGGKKPKAKPKAKRQPSQYNIFFKEMRKKGYSPAEVGQLWNEHKNA